MAIFSTGSYFGGKLLVRPEPSDPRFRYALERGANSLTVPIGQEPTRGYFLMLREDVAAIDLTAPQTFQLLSSEMHRGGRVDQTSTLDFPNLYVVNDPLRIDGVGDANPVAVYLVDVADIRHALNRFSCLSKCYNLRKPGPGYKIASAERFYSASLDSAALWTWDTLCEDIWDQIGVEIGSYPGLPYTPLGSPEDFRFFGVNAWDALHQVLAQIGCTTKPLPTQATVGFDIVQLGEDQANLTTYETKYNAKEKHNLDALDAVALRVPHTIRVFFYYRDERQPDNWALAPYSVDKTTGVTGAIAGTVLPLWSYIPARYDFTSGLQDSSALSNLAGEIKDNWLQIHNVARARKVYMGIVADVLPGELIRAVEWRDAGYGWQTTTSRRPEVSLASEKPPSWVASAERLHSVEHWIKFELTESLSAGSNASAYVRMFVSGAWVNNVSAVTATVDVYDSLGTFSAPVGSYGWARWSTESMRYEVKQLECA